MAGYWEDQIGSESDCSALADLSPDFWSLMTESCHRCRFCYGPCMARSLIDLAEQTEQYRRANPNWMANRRI